MSDRLYNWPVDSASKSLFLSLNNISGDRTETLLWGLILLALLVLLFAFAAVALLIRLQRSRTELNHLRQQYEQLSTRASPQSATDATSLVATSTAPQETQGLFNPLTQLPTRTIIATTINTVLQPSSPQTSSPL